MLIHSVTIQLEHILVRESLRPVTHKKYLYCSLFSQRFKNISGSHNSSRSFGSDNCHMLSLKIHSLQPPGHRLVPVHGLLGTRPHSRRWAAGKQVKLHLYLQLLPVAHLTAWAPPPVRSAAALDSHRNTNPTVNCACKGSRMHAPYENLMPDDLRWSWGGDASTGEQLQIQIIISREVWLHRDHNKSIACRLISKPYQWVANDN